MRTLCPRCDHIYDDEYQWTICPHNPLVTSHEEGAYCRQHDYFHPCKVCKILEEMKKEKQQKSYTLFIIETGLPAVGMVIDTELPEQGTDTCEWKKETAAKSDLFSYRA